MAYGRSMTSEPSADPTVTDNPQQSQYEIHVDGDLAGFAQYHRYDDRIEFTHTVVEDAYEGQGLAGRLASHALDEARRDGLLVVPTCPYVRSYIKRHPEYRELVAPGR